MPFLVHDDIVDGSQRRRGRQTLPAEYGRDRVDELEPEDYLPDRDFVEALVPYMLDRRA